jgi:tRNA(Arg) A34 adenosine deaminase TadA
MCLAAAYWARVDRVVYAATREDAANIGFDDEHLYKELALPVDQRSLPMNQLLRSESVNVFQAWQKMENRVAY